MDVIAIPNNTLVVAYNDSPNKRSPLRLATSTDGGLTWVKAAVIENDPEGSFHYPALLYDAKKVSDNSILLQLSLRRQLCIAVRPARLDLYCQELTVRAKMSRSYVSRLDAVWQS